MPLSAGSDRATISKNIREMVAAGHPQKQAVAASLDNARRHPRLRRAVGGLLPGDFAGWWQRNQADPVMRQGLVNGVTPGRADKLNYSVPSGAYVIPADVVSGFGQGNTNNGAQKLDDIFTNRVSTRGFATGGGVGTLVPVKLSDGEYVVAPETVASIGDGDIDYGHDILDSFVKQLRNTHRKTLDKLPGPVR